MIGDFFNELWIILLELAPYLLLGLLIAGLLNAFVPRKQIEKHLGKNNLSSIIKAALVGVPLPLCSCGVIPTGIAIKKHGASNGATISFLASTPQTGVDSILITYSMMGMPWAIFRPIAAFITGILAGSVAPKDQQQGNKAAIVEDEQESNYPNLFEKIFKYAFVDFLKDISRPLITGIILATIITLAIPDSLFESYLTNPFLNMLIVLVASIPLYVCATGSVPIAAALLLKGLSPGAAFVFLMAGPATNAATITVLWRSLGKRTTIIYVGSITVLSLLFGWIIDAYFMDLMGMAQNLSDHVHGSDYSWISNGSAVVLIANLIFVEASKLRTKKVEVNAMEKAYKVEGMTCNHCKANVERSLKEIDKVEQVQVDLDNGIALVQGQVEDLDIKSKIEEIGYRFKGAL